MPYKEPPVEHQFKKGQSGNPKGKPKGAVSLVTKMREALDKIYEGTEQPVHEALIKSMIKDAIKTDGQSRRLMLQYLEGMPKETKDIKVDLPRPLLSNLDNGISDNNSDQEDSEVNQKD